MSGTGTALHLGSIPLYKGRSKSGGVFIAHTASSAHARVVRGLAEMTKIPEGSFVHGRVCLAAAPLKPQHKHLAPRICPSSLPSQPAAPPPAASPPSASMFRRHRDLPRHSSPHSTPGLANAARHVIDTLF